MRIGEIQWIDEPAATQPERRDSLLARIFGIVLAGSGIAHFVAPGFFRALSKIVFPDDTARWVKINGGCETAIGLAIAVRPSRIAGFAGLIAYGFYLADRVFVRIRNQLKSGAAG